MFAAPLSSNLKGTHGIKTLPVRSGDTVRIMRGDHKDFEGKITRVDTGKYRIYVEGLTREKVDGTTISVPVHPSKVMITNLNLDDKWRKEILARKKAPKKKIEEVAQKPAKKAAKEVVEVKAEPIAEKAPAEEKAAEKKPKRARKTTARKPAAAKKEKIAAEEAKEEEPKPKKPRAKRKTTKKTEGET
jgi:large subunit ribosomal protein L24